MKKIVLLSVILKSLSPAVWAMDNQDHLPLSLRLYCNPITRLPATGGDAIMDFVNQIRAKATRLSGYQVGNIIRKLTEIQPEEQRNASMAFVREIFSQIPEMPQNDSLIGAYICRIFGQLGQSPSLPQNVMDFIQTLTPHFVYASEYDLVDFLMEIGTLANAPQSQESMRFIQRIALYPNRLSAHTVAEIFSGIRCMKNPDQLPAILRFTEEILPKVPGFLNVHFRPVIGYLTSISDSTKSQALMNDVQNIATWTKIEGQSVVSLLYGLNRLDPDVRTNHMLHGEAFWSWIPNLYGEYIMEPVFLVISAGHTQRFITLCESIRGTQPPPLEGACFLLSNLSRLRAEDADRWVIAVQNRRPTTTDEATNLLNQTLHPAPQIANQPHELRRRCIAFEVHEESIPFISLAQNFFDANAETYQRFPDFPATEQEAQQQAIQTLKTVIGEINWAEITAASNGEQVTTDKALEILNGVKALNLDSPKTRLYKYLPLIVHHMKSKNLLPLYVTNWITDSANAYNDGDKGSCIPGIGQRMISTALLVDEEFQKIFAPALCVTQMKNLCLRHVEKQTAAAFIETHLGQPLEADLPLDAKHEAFFQAFLKAERINQRFLDQHKPFQTRGLEAILREDWVSNLPPEAFTLKKQGSNSHQSFETEENGKASDTGNDGLTNSIPVTEPATLPPFAEVVLQANQALIADATVDEGMIEGEARNVTEMLIEPAIPQASGEILPQSTAAMIDDTAADEGYESDKAMKRTRI